MSVTITPGAARAINAAADWLEANPDKHIAASMSENKNGRCVPPTDPTADCFCALGRIAKEAGIEQRSQHADKLTVYPITNIETWLLNNIDLASSNITAGSLAYSIWSTNDRDQPEDNDLGHPDVIPLLRKIARGEIDE